MNHIAFLFPGQGSQHVGMGKEFYESSSFAQETFKRADEILGYSLSRLCFDGPVEKLKLTESTQPALLVVSYIAFSLLKRNPLIGAGHSLGEYSGLVAAGSLSFEEAVILVHKRGKYMQEAVPPGEGAMAAILGVEYNEVTKALEKVKEGIVDIANWNSERQIVIAGHKHAVEEALSILSPPRSVLLPVSAPFHSRLMKDAEEKLSYDLDYVEFKDLNFPIVTNVDAKIIRSGDEARNALKRQVSHPVLWYESMGILEKEGIELYIELGSGKVLSGLIKRIGRRWASSPATFNIDGPESLKSALEKFF